MALANDLGVAPAPFLAGGAITQYRMVKSDSTAGRVVAATAIADVALGVALNTASAAGDPVQVQTFGIAKVTASAAVTLGDELMVTASGAGKVSTASGATAQTIGVALEAATADGDIITVLLACPGVKRAANS